jgi:hypothetical protein
MILPFPRLHTPPAPARTTTRQWHIERTYTEPLNFQQNNQAVTALAALITQWKHGTRNTGKTPDAATVIDLLIPRQTSDNGTGSGTTQHRRQRDRNGKSKRDEGDNGEAT